MQEDTNLAKEVLKRIQVLGRIEKIIEELVRYELFRDLSKHNPYFHSSDEVASDKLEEIRLKLDYIHDTLLEILADVSLDD